MGRFSHLPTTSSSSYRSISSTARRRSGTTVGFPKKCFCGLDPVIRTSTTVDNPGRRFYGCVNYQDGGYHIIKWWDEAMMEEFHELKLSVDDQGEKIDHIFLHYAETDSVTALQNDLLKTQAAIAKLKELLPEKPSVDMKGGIELKNLMLGGVLLMLLLITIYVLLV